MPILSRPFPSCISGSTGITPETASPPRRRRTTFPNRTLTVFSAPPSFMVVVPETVIAYSVPSSETARSPNEKLMPSTSAVYVLPPPSATTE